MEAQWCPAKSQRTKRAQEFWGGLASIIEVRISGPPGSGTLRMNLPEWVNDNPCSMMDSVILGAKSERTLRAQGFGAV